MRAAVVNRILACLLAITFLGIALAQAPEQKNLPRKEDPQELGPGTAKTKEEATEAAKATPGLPPVSAPVDPKTYVIGPEDILAIKVWREPELSQGAQVRPDGKITMQLVGELQAAGLTPAQLQAKVIEALSEYINKPEVNVSLMSVQSKKYYITGEVSRPGTYPLVVPVTVLEALTNAGSFREFANTKKITILRNKKILKFNYNDVVKGKNTDQNVLIENGDYIVVP